MNILNRIRKSAEQYPQEPAIITASDGQVFTYAETYRRMKAGEQLPIPLLGNSWDSNFILHTTGTTGKSKSVIISQQAVIANSDNLIIAHGYTHKQVMLITGPMDHLGCWSKLFPTLISGGTLYIIEDGMKNVNDFFKPFNLMPERRFATFLVPSALRILLSQAQDRLAAHAASIDFIEAGGAPLPRPDMLRLCEILPKSRLFNTYASTETGVIATYNFNDGRCLSGCVGHAMRHSSVVITKEGTIACKGDTLMSGYENDEELTRQVLHNDTFFTADSGWIDEEGMLHIGGRIDDIINVGGLKLAPQEVEEAALAHPMVNDCVCIAEPHPILGQAPALLLVLAEGYTLDKRALARHINDRLERYKVPLKYTVVESIEKTPNGKINRKAYREKQ